MEKCPVCSCLMVAGVCGDCGFDSSCHYEAFPTLGHFFGSIQSVSGRKAAMEEEQRGFFVCPKCGKQAFSIRFEDQTIHCLNCREVQNMMDYLPEAADIGSREAEKKRLASESINILAQHLMNLKSEGKQAKVLPSNTEKAALLQSLSSVLTQHTQAVQSERNVQAVNIIKCLEPFTRSKYSAAGQRQASAALSDEHAVILYRDGTAAAVGANDCGQCNVGNWTNLQEVYAGRKFTLGLCKYGSVLFAGSDSNGLRQITGLNHIAAVSVGEEHVACLRKDGIVTVVGSCTDQQEAVSHWRQMKAVAAGGGHTLGLRKSGIVEAVGRNSEGQCGVRNWQRIKAVAAGSRHSVGLRSDGTVIAAGSNQYGECNVRDWRHIVAIAAGAHCTMGVRTDGSVVFTGKPFNGAEEIKKWKYIVSLHICDSCVLGIDRFGNFMVAGGDYGA